MSIKRTTERKRQTVEQTGRCDCVAMSWQHDIAATAEGNPALTPF